MASGILNNYIITPSVASNNLTVALKALDGNDATVANPIRVRIGNVDRSITGALAVTKNAGTNWCNSGGAELATKEIDYFVYLGYNATDGVVIGFSRIPYGALYSDFSATTTNEKYCAISTIANAAAGDNYVVIGRFAATLSAGAGYTWTVPTFTAINLVQHPVYETRWLEWVPQPTPEEGTYTSIRYLDIYYKVVGSHHVDFILSIDGTCNLTPTYIDLTLPFTTLVTQIGTIGYQPGNDAVGKFAQYGATVRMALVGASFAASTYQGLSGQFVGRI